MDPRQLIDGLRARAAELENDMILTHPRIGPANVRLVELEKQLGLPPGPKLFNICKANVRIAELETQLRGSTISGMPAASQVAITLPPRSAAPAGVPTFSAPAATPRMKRHLMLEIANRIFRTEIRDPLELDNVELAGKIQLAVLKTGVAIPGFVAPSAEAGRATVSARQFRAITQDLADQILKDHS